MADFNPFFYDQSHTASSGTIEISVNERCKYVRLYPVTGGQNVKVFINSTNNTPGGTICEGLSISNKDGRISKLVLSFSGTATVNVKQVGFPGGIISRAGL